MLWSIKQLYFTYFCKRYERALIRACFGDVGKARRLMQYEADKCGRPKLHKYEAAKLAFERLEYDRS